MQNLLLFQRCKAATVFFQRTTMEPENEGHKAGTEAVSPPTWGLRVPSEEGCLMSSSLSHTLNVFSLDCRSWEETRSSVVKFGGILPFLVLATGSYNKRKLLKQLFECLVSQNKATTTKIRKTKQNKKPKTPHGWTIGIEVRYWKKLHW